MDNKTNYLQQANRLGLFFIILFIICFLWFYINPIEKELHQQLFRLTFFGFSDMSVIGFISGLVQSYVWGYVFIGIWKVVSGIGGFKDNN
ncbi:MAG: hypothetical protein ABIG88_02555 [Patescibacteria group bacterium]|nr:hypothetical protein [Patescibacteria group bacterium]